MIGQINNFQNQMTDCLTGDNAIYNFYLSIRKFIPSKLTVSKPGNDISTSILIPLMKTTVFFIISVPGPTKALNAYRDRYVFKFPVTTMQWIHTGFFSLNLVGIEKKIRDGDVPKVIPFLIYSTYNCPSSRGVRQLWLSFQETSVLRVSAEISDIFVVSSLVNIF